MKSLSILFLTVLSSHVFADAFIFDSELKPVDLKILKTEFAKVQNQLPSKFLNSLPQNIKIKVKNISPEFSKIPVPKCEILKEELEASKKKKKDLGPNYVYGRYIKASNTLELDRLVVEVLAQPSNEEEFTCMHRNIYQQAVATIVHELGHAYDLKGSESKLFKSAVSSDYEYRRLAGFKKGWIKLKNKNVKASRSADNYEYENIFESFAVNFEYFVMDEEMACRRPMLFNYFAKHFKTDPYPNRKCKINTNVVVNFGQMNANFDLDPARVYRVDYLLASPGKDMVSGFGHAMFRFVVCAPAHKMIDPRSLDKDHPTFIEIPATPYGPECLKDKEFHIVGSYRASIEDAKLDKLKGFLGGYPSVLFMLPYQQVIDEYTKDEFRDLISYPINLTEAEKYNFVLKAIEDHWTYRGDYKFVTNNCAVESQDLLKSSIYNDDVQAVSIFTPNGLLEEMKENNLILNEEPLTYKSKIDSYIDAYLLITGFKSKGKKKDEKAVRFYLTQTTAKERLQMFEDVFAQYQLKGDSQLNTLERLHKARTMSASFAVLEQQVARMHVSELRKKISEYMMNLEEGELKTDLDKKTKAIMDAMSPKKITKIGYGIPLVEEQTSNEELFKKADETKKVTEELKDLMNRIFATDAAELKNEEANHNQFVNKTTEVIRILRGESEKYLNESLDGYVLMPTYRELLEKSLTSDEALLEVRKLLDERFYSEKSLSSFRLRNLIKAKLGIVL